MTAAVYNRQSLGQNAGLLAVSPIDVRIESEATPEEISQFLVSLASFISIQGNAAHEEGMHSSEGDGAFYLSNKFGDDYACCDVLGFERSYLGPRADFNHIF